MNTRPHYRILLVEDDPDDHLIVQSLLEEVELWTHELVWVRTYNEAISTIDSAEFDVALVDYRLGGRRGSDFIGEPSVRRAGVPVIVLTGEAGREADIVSGAAGAADFLAKRGLDAPRLERTIRYTVEDWRRHKVEARFRALIENSRDLITVLGRDGRISYVSPSVERVLGFLPTDKAGADALGEVHPEDHGEVDEAFRSLLTEPAGSRRLQYRVRHADGNWRWLDTIAQNLLHDPLIAGIVVNSWDVTELRETQHRTRFQSALLGRVAQAILAVDDQNRVTYWNHAAEALSGYSAEEVMGQTVLDRIVAPESLETGLWARETASRGELWEGDLVVKRKDGRTVTAHVTVSPAINPDGSPGGRIALGQDVTELRRAEAEKARANERVRFQAELLGAVGQAVIATDVEGTIIYCNRAAEDLYGWPAEEAIGRSVLEVTPAAGSLDQAAEIMNVLRAGEVWSGEFEVRRKDGSTFMAGVVDAPIFDEEGQLSGIIGVSSDISEQRELEQQFRQAQKMEAVGRLAGGVAHDFNNLITAIRGHCELLMEDLPASSALRDDVLQIEKAGDRAAALTRQLLAFSRKQVLSERALDLRDAVRETQDMLRRMIPERIRINVALPEEPVIVKADPGQLTQVMMNLVLNAADAIERTGRIDLSVDRHTMDDASAEALPWTAEPGEYALLVVADDGSGMAPEVVARVFEPFFTTKEEGRGTGLGLSTVYGIVKQSGGHILVHSEPGAGTRFDILLPLAATSRVENVNDEDELNAESTIDGGTVLLVEDDDAVRNLARRVLQRAGYTVVEAPHGGAALDIISDRSDDIDLVLSDVVMPEMGGVELAGHLRTRFPQLRLILMSGYSEAALRGELADAASTFLMKPFTPAALLDAVAQATRSN